MLTYAAELSNLVAGKNIFSFIEKVLSNKADVIITYEQLMTYKQQARQAIDKEIAKTMLQAQKPKEEVSKFTGLTLQQVEHLIRDQRNA